MHSSSPPASTRQYFLLQRVEISMDDAREATDACTAAPHEMASMPYEAEVALSFQQLT